MSLETIFQDRNSCLKQMGEARQVFCNSNSTDDHREQAMKVLVLAKVYCPMDLIDIVDAYISECTKREIMIKTKGKISPEVWKFLHRR